SDTTPSFSGTAEAGSTVEILRDGVVVGSVTADGSGAWTWTSDELDDGTHAFTVRATDEAGNVSALSDALGVTIDTTAPSDSGSSTPTLDEGASITLDGWLHQGDDVDTDVAYEVVALSNG